MSAPRRLPIAVSAACITLGPVLLAGCGKSTGPTQLGDTGGVHLVAYASNRSITGGQFDIFLYDLDNLGFRALPNLNSSTQDDLDPSLTSDGRFIAFQSARAASGMDIHVYDRGAPGLIDLPGVNTPQNETEPAFTGDALKLAFVRDTLNFRRIRLIDGRNFKLIPLPGLDTSASYHDFSPGPNHSGSRIAFVSNRLGDNDVFVWDAGFRGVLDLTALRYAAADDVDPVLTADGRYVCFASNRPGGQGGYDLYLYDIQDRVFVPLTGVNTPSDERAPSMNGGGIVICFQSNRTDGLGGIDVWNHNRGSGQTGQGTEQSSTSADLSPSVRWP